ncbi:hypothetical protein [Microcoleus sp. F4-D5]
MRSQFVLNIYGKLVNCDRPCRQISLSTRTAICQGPCGSCSVQAIAPVT